MTFLPHTSPKILPEMNSGQAAVAKAMAAFFESSETKISIKSILKIIKASYLLKTGTKNETDIEISFSQHFFMTLTVLSIVLLGLVLIVMIPTVSSGVSMFILEGILVVLGIVFWIDIKKKIERDIQKHKTLISEILES